MKAALKQSALLRIWHFANDIRFEGAPSGVTGNLSGVRGDLSEVRGDLSGVTGTLTGVTGNLDACELTDEDRKRGVDISELIERESAGVTK